MHTDRSCVWQDKVNSVLKQLEKLTLPNGALETWKNICIPNNPKNRIGIKTLDKFKVPTQCEINTWTSLPKGTLSSLQKIKHPILCGWTMCEITKGTTPYLNSHGAKYKTNRTIMEDCQQDGAMGVIKAIRTDAGIAKFATHVYRHIQTNIRRRSVGSALISRPERRPSTTDVKVEITNFLTGDWERLERDALAQRWKRDGYSLGLFVNFDQIEGNLARDYVQSVYPKAYKQMLDEIEGKIGEDLHCAFSDCAVRHLSRKELSLVRVDAKEIKKSISKMAKDNVRKLGIDGLVLNARNLVSEDMFTSISAQRTGSNRAFLRVVSSRFRLLDLGLNMVYDLIDYLNFRFSVDGGDIISFFDETKHATVGDIVRIIASAPEFHSTPVALDVEVGSDDQRHEAVDVGVENVCTQRFRRPDVEAIDNLHRDFVRKVVRDIRDKLELNRGQEIIFCFTYGLSILVNQRTLDRFSRLCPGNVVDNDDGTFTFTPVPVSGTWLADNFRELNGEEPAKISRQRISEQTKKIIMKIRSKWFEVGVVGDAGNLEKARVRADLTVSEKCVCDAFYGLFSWRKRSVDDIAENYDDIVSGCGEYKHQSLDKRRMLVKLKLQDIQNKLLFASIE